MTKFVALLGAVEIDTTNQRIRLTEAAATANADIAVGTYYLRGDGSASDLCLAIKNALDGAFVGGNTYTVGIVTSAGVISWDTNPANKSATVVIDVVGAINFKVAWNDAAATFPKGLVGFSAEKGAANLVKEVSTLTPSSVWVCNEYHKDSKPATAWNTRSETLANGDTSVTRRSDKAQRRKIAFQWVDGRRTWLSINTADPTAALESFIDTNNDGRPIEFHEQSLLSSAATTLSALSSATRVGTAWRLSEGAGDALDADRAQLGLDLWDLDLTLSGAV